jgi:hypothetical protein
MPAARAAKMAGKAGAKTSLKAGPVVNGGDSPHTETLKARLTELRTKGFNRLYQQGKIVEFSTPESLLDLDFTLPVFVLLDRIVVRIGRALWMRRRSLTARVARSFSKKFHAMKLASANVTDFLVRLSAQAATGRARSRSRGCSALTIRLGLARGARDSAIQWTSI